MFEAKLVCDGLSCWEERDLPIEHPDDALIEVEKLVDGRGWSFDFESGFCYCPKCAAKVEAENE